MRPHHITNKERNKLAFDMTDDMGHQKPVTMRKVAEVASVSMATVSRVLNGSGPVDPQVAQRARAVINSLRYHPNRAANPLDNTRSEFLGLFLYDLLNTFFKHLMMDILYTPTTTASSLRL